MLQVPGNVRLLSGDTMYKLTDNPILTSYQTIFLRQFFSTSFSTPFFLTGGTALSAFYLAHRESRDLVLFSLQTFDVLEMKITLQTIATSMEANLETKISSPAYHELYLTNKNQGWRQRIDLVQDQPKRFGTIETIEGVRVDALENIATNKILTILGRLEPKDYVDLYTILTKTDLTFDYLFPLAKEKDTGLNEFTFANIIASVGQLETYPTMRINFDRQQMVSYFEDLSRKLLLSIKPKG